VDRGGPAQFDAFVRTLQRRMNRKVPAVVLGGGFAFLFYLFYPASDHPWGFPVTSHFHGAWRSWILTPDLVIQTALVLVLGFVGWRLMVIAWEVWHLAGDFDFRFDLRHPDKSAGLAPLGDLCFSLAAVWAVVAIYPTTWVAILHFAPLAKTGWFSLGHLFHTTNHILDEVRQHQAKLKDIRPAILIAIRGPLFWLSWYVLGLLGVTLAFAVGTFALPLYFVHRGMVRQHPEQVASLDGLGLKIHRLAARIREQASAVETEAATGEGGDGKATPDAAGAAGGGSTGGKAQAVSAEHLDRLKDLNARLKAVEDVYTKSKLIPSWPFDAKVFGKFVGATVVPLTGLTTLVPKILDKFITGGT